jgi:hypothetical protein
MGWLNQLFPMELVASVSPAGIRSAVAKSPSAQRGGTTAQQTVKAASIVVSQDSRSRGLRPAAVQNVPVRRRGAHERSLN